MPSVENALRTDKLLLDTHAFLWWRTDDARLPRAARSAISDADVVFVSAATAWEAAIKVSLGRLELPDTIETGVEDSGFEKLPITFSHAEAAAKLPPRHRDPFDRMLIAQAIAENLTLVSHDQKIAQYPVAVLWG